MAPVVSLQRAAEAIADRARAGTRVDEASARSLSEALAMYHAHCADAQRTRNGRELTLFEADPERIGRFVDLVVEGNYRETAAAIAGLKPRAVRMWMQKADEGDERYEAFAQVVRASEALAESSAVRSVRAAGKDPRFWAAEMTYLERKYPDRWGRRQDDTQVARVIVQIGAKDSDVQVSVATLTPVAAIPTTRETDLSQCQVVRPPSSDRERRITATRSRKNAQECTTL